MRSSSGEGSAIGLTDAFAEAEVCVRRCGYASRMTARYALADIAALVGESSRAAILLALLDGRELPAGGLARKAGLSAAATRLHLAKLTLGGRLVVRRE